MENKRAYDLGKPLSRGTSLGWWILDTVHCLLVVLSSAYALWPVPVNETAALIGGAVALVVGLILMLMGMFEFRSIRRVSGLDSSELVTTGIYRWSRNPQYLGWFLVLFGASLIGRSGLALLYTTVGVILFHFYITRMEEPYLERIFGDEYRLYKSRTPRYIGMSRRRKLRRH